MKIRHYFSLILILVASFFYNTTALAGEVDNLPNLPQKFSYLVDFTNTLSNNEQSNIEKKLIDFNKVSGSQLAVVIIKSTDGYDISQYAFALGQKWGVGRKKNDDGVLMLVAKNDHKIFIATGYGLEGALPDALLSQIIRHEITPSFKQNNYFKGISQGVDAIILAAKGEYTPDEDSDTSLQDILPFLFMAFFIGLLIFRDSLREKRYISPNSSTRSTIDQAIITSSLFGRDDNDHFGGFGGGSGGFGGGGFGGGGAGGSW